MLHGFDHLQPTPFSRHAIASAPSDAPSTIGEEMDYL
jgi:hypothetical protein